MTYREYIYKVITGTDLSDQEEVTELISWLANELLEKTSFCPILLNFVAHLLFFGPFRRCTFASNKNRNDMETKINIIQWFIVAFAAVSSIAITAICLTELFQFVNSMNYSSLSDWCSSNFM